MYILYAIYMLQNKSIQGYSLFIDVFGHHCGIKVITISIHVDGPWLDHMVHGIVLMCLDKPCVVYDCFTLVSYYYMLYPLSISITSVMLKLADIPASVSTVPNYVDMSF